MNFYLNGGLGVDIIAFWGIGSADINYTL